MKFYYSYCDFFLLFYCIFIYNLFVLLKLYFFKVFFIFKDGFSLNILLFWIFFLNMVFFFDKIFLVCIIRIWWYRDFFIFFVGFEKWFNDIIFNLFIFILDLSFVMKFCLFIFVICIFSFEWGNMFVFEIYILIW